MRQRVCGGSELYSVIKNTPEKERAREKGIKMKKMKHRMGKERGGGGREEERR